MKLWSDTLSRAHMRAAARKANVDITREIESPARKRAFRWEIALSGDSPYKQGNGDGFPGATWDQWGIFLAELFRLDPNMSSEYYADEATFHAVTDDRFDTLSYADSHRVHDWRWMPIGRVTHFVCNGCTAERWPDARPYDDARYAPTA